MFLPNSVVFLKANGCYLNVLFM